MDKLDELISDFKRLVRYGINGIVNTIVTYGIFLIVSNFIDYRIAIVIAFIPGIFTSYLLNKRYIFKKDGKLVIFIIIVGVMLVVNITVTWILVEYIEITKEIAQAFAILIAFLLGYYLNKKYAF